LTRKGLLKTAVVIPSAITLTALLASATAPAASADSMRTLNLSLTCATGLAYGLEANTGSGWFYPVGSSYASGTTKYYTVSIPASATSLEVQPTYCDNQPTGYGPYFVGYSYGITPGTSTINVNGNCLDYSYNPGYGEEDLLYYTSLSSLTY
jgi:hypothetical protein